MTGAAPGIAPAAIEYHLAADDQGAVAAHYLAHSAAGKRIVTRSAVRALILLGAAGAFFALEDDRPVAIACAAGAVIAFLAIPGYMRWALRRAVERRPVSGLCPCGGGRHRMDASDAGLRITCEAADTLRPWHTIAAVEETAQHLFVMLVGAAGYPVNRETMLAGDLDAFAASARAYRARALEPAD